MRGVPFLNFERDPGVPLLNFEGGPGVPLLNIRGVPGPTFTPCPAGTTTFSDVTLQLGHIY